MSSLIPCPVSNRVQHYLIQSHSWGGREWQNWEEQFWIPSNKLEKLEPGQQRGTRKGRWRTESRTRSWEWAHWAWRRDSLRGAQKQLPGTRRVPKEMEPSPHGWAVWDKGPRSGTETGGILTGLKETKQTKSPHWGHNWAVKWAKRGREISTFPRKFLRSDKFPCKPVWIKPCFEQEAGLWISQGLYQDVLGQA